jgi:putative RNA 2'-phosphotransferase
MNKRLTRISKYMSFILCHEPGSIGLTLDADGWADVAEFVAKANAAGKSVKADYVFAVVDGSDPKRFELSDDRSRVRAIPASGARTQTAKSKSAKSKPVKKTVFTKSRMVAGSLRRAKK